MQVRCTNSLELESSEFAKPRRSRSTRWSQLVYGRDADGELAPVKAPELSDAGRGAGLKQPTAHKLLKNHNTIKFYYPVDFCFLPS